MDNNNGKNSSGKGLLILLAGFTVLILMVYGANTLYSKLSANRKSEAEQKLVVDMAQNKEQSSDESATDSLSKEESEKNTNTKNGIPRAPEFIVYTADGEAVKFSDKVGKPIIVNFWATWCGPCQREMPHFQEAYSEYGDKIEFMMINSTDGIRDTNAKVDKFISENGYTFPVYRDTSLSAVSLYGVASLPMTFFIDSDGYVLGYIPGAMNKETLYACIDILLGEE